MLCSPPPATTLASSCAGSEGFCAPCCRRSSQRSRIHNRPKTGRTLLLHERLLGLVNERSHPPDQTRKLTASPNRLGRIASMLECIFISLRRSGRSSAVHSTPAVRHRGRPARCPFPRARATPRAAVHGQFGSHETAPPISSDALLWARPRQRRPDRR